MNTETQQENALSMTVGERLRQAREASGFSQEMVADRLCLMLSTVREIEENRLPERLAVTFVHGYIRAYAKLVRLPEEGVLPLLTKPIAVKVANVAPMQSFSQSKRRKKRDDWLMIFTWLILLVIVGLTGLWWWQNHVAQQQEMEIMAEHLSEPAMQDIQQSDLANEQTPEPRPVASVSETIAIRPTEPSPTIISNEVALYVAATQAQSLTSEMDDQLVVSHTLQIDFSGDCWIEIHDTTNKTLVSRLQRKGSSLSIDGEPPYKLKLGVPSAVQIQYQGKAVDLGSLVNSNRVARVTIPVQPE